MLKIIKQQWNLVANLVFHSVQTITIARLESLHEIIKIAVAIQTEPQ
jgi:hypothetical protein